jgi:hypothetical protein
LKAPSRPRFEPDQIWTTGTGWRTRRNYATHQTWDKTTCLLKQIELNTLYQSGPLIEAIHALFDMIQLFLSEQYEIIGGNLLEPVDGNMIAFHGWTGC